MGFSHKSNEKRSDKETQSPMLRVFKEIMQKEHKDSEKSNLLKEKQEKQKKKSYSRTKADQPIQSEKRDSWWLWKDEKKKKKRTDDTCSCATCPLKKLVGSDYACIGCLVFVFIVSVAATFMLVFRTMPLSLGLAKEETLETKKTTEGDSSTERSLWNSELAKRLGSYSGLFGPGSGDSSFQDPNLLDEGVSSELAGVIGTDKMIEIQNNEKLREFYKKLIETDAQIKKLKQGLENNHVMNTEINNKINTPDRYKRSLKFVAKHRISRNKNRHAKANSTNRVQRSKITDLGKPEGLLIENKKVLIQYKPIEEKRKFPKCSHAPKESKSHEEHMKHPFYQNSQRLDELLDHLLDRNIPEIMTDPLELDVLFSNKGKCNHKTEHFNKESNVNEEAKTTTETTTNKVNQIDKKAKEVVSTESIPLINQYRHNITIFDKAMENQNYENSHNSMKVESNDKTKDFNDRSSKFMSKIHGNNGNKLKSYFEGLDKMYTSTENLSPEVNYNYRKSYNQNYDFGHPNEVGNDNRRIDENDHFDDQFNRDVQRNHLMELMTDRASTVKKFDINLDYNDILFSVTPRTIPLRMTAFMQPENQDLNPSLIADQRSRAYNHRKLLQVDEGNEETLAYEDLKEVLADEMETHDETERGVDRNKRNENVPDVYNRNWKGPMPLYPEELNAIIKQAAMENVKVPVKTKDVINNDETNKISDTDYIEDYFDSKYDRLVEMAQAYSDYGVLDDKKGSVDQKGTTVKPNVKRHKMSLDQNTIKRQLGGFPQKSEGIRFEIKPGKCNKESDLFKAIRKHFKIASVKKRPQSSAIPYLQPSFDPLLNPSIHDPLIKSSMITQKLYTKSSGASLSVPKRGLKSVESIDVDDFEDVNRGVITKDDSTVFNIDANVNETKRDTKKDGIGNKNNKTMGAGEFFAMVSDWFNTLAKLSGETFGLKNSSILNNSTNNSIIKRNTSEEVLYPTYDSDMIENIAHRSRVLLSLDDKNASAKITEVKDKEEGRRTKEDNVQVTPTIITDSSTFTTKQGVENVTKSNISELRNDIKKEDNNIDNKTISKRSIPRDSKLIVWNDIYDDEYGVKMDYFEKPIRDKHSLSSGNFVKRSKNWIGGKVKNIADKFRGTKRDIGGTEKSSTKDVNALLPRPKRISSKIRRRNIRNIIGDDVDDTNDFAALTANMKKVVREAVNAVKQTRNIKVREDNHEDAMASSLMQQLVKLMSEVVDFQVQQRTCSKLPPDLQTFLEWLTSPSEKENSLPDLNMDTYSTNTGYRYEKSADDIGVLMPGDHLDDRTQCLGSIQAVQELMRRYDEMDEVDKSKMSGVKQYLENQLDFLKGKVNSIDELNMYKYYKKRETNSGNRDLNKLRRAQKRRVKRRIRKLIKNFNKHKTTVSSTVTETKKMKK
ncbi:uncharacterized protein [Epargyreus clarus]|uniref:uncharacterized protein isoform X2 n=1 Tax=Epargyreus clarus TaxID=520877 RepID=UPI003C2F460B